MEKDKKRVDSGLWDAVGLMVKAGLVAKNERKTVFMLLSAFLPQIRERYTGNLRIRLQDGRVHRDIWQSKAEVRIDLQRMMGERKRAAPREELIVRPFHGPKR